MDAFLPEHNEEKLLLFGYAIASLFFISVLRGLYIFLKTGNPCDFVFVIGCTVSLGVLWQTGPQLIDDTVNPITSTSPLPPITAAQNLFHQSLTIVDFHADSLLWSYRNLNLRSSSGHVDIPRLLEGNVAIQAFTIVTKSPKNMNFESNVNTSDSLTLLGLVQQWSPALIFGGNNLLARAIFQCQQLHTFSKLSNNQLVVLKNQIDLRNYLLHRKQHPGKTTAGVLGIEGMHALEGKLENIDKLYDEGVRMMAPVHFFDNKLGGSAHGVTKYGLTEFGKLVIRKMEAKSMILDVAHSSTLLLDDIILFAERPFVVSHTGVRGTCNNTRNLADTHIESIALLGGMISIAYFDQAVCGTSVKHIVDAIKYVRDLVGIDYVGLGSDFDGSVEVAFDTSKLNRLTSFLLDDGGFSKEDVKKVMGGNALRLLQLLLPKE